MDGYGPIRQTLADEEKLGLLDARLSSDSESDVVPIEVDRSFKIPKWAIFLTTPSTYHSTIHWKTLFVRSLLFFIPSFLQGRHAREQIRPAKLHPTAYLDGMRGLAALFVYFCHYSYQGFIIAEGWGCGPKNYHILKLPILRLWYQGPAAVAVFFVISGYALCYRPLKLARSGAFADFQGSMGSLVFRRWMRLFLPPIISTWMIFCFLRLGAYEWTREFAMDRTFHRNIMEPHPEAWEDGYAQFWDWFWDMFKFVHVWDWAPHGGSTFYDVHLWTIPIEYRCSLYLFLVLIGTARLRTRYRVMTVLAVLWFTYRNSRWEFSLFLAGNLIAEMDLARGAHTPPPALPIAEKQKLRSYDRLRSLVWGLVCVMGLYLLSFPDGRAGITPGWRWITSSIPWWWGEEHFRYWQCIGAVVFITGVSHSPSWQAFFNTSVVQYFGKISYALYLMHGPAMHVMGYHWEKWAFGLTGVEGHNYTIGFFLGASLCVPTVIWWADVFWRAVDIPTVKFAKWFESKLVVRK